MSAASSTPASPAADQGPKSPISEIALILGLSALIGVVALFLSFLAWRAHVRGRPGYEARRLQRKHGISAVSVRIRGALAHSLGRHSHPPADTAATAAEEPMPDLTTIVPVLGQEEEEEEAQQTQSQDSTFALNSAFSHPPLPDLEAAVEPCTVPVVVDHRALPQRPSRPCFRTSSDVLPPRLCKTYVWQQDEKPSTLHRLPDISDDDENEDDGSANPVSHPRSDGRSVKSIAIGWDENEEDHPSPPQGEVKP
ncbi:hypothetical protein HKX48_004016 [Thoreauomyces humboldtii]|nr:hypothetical protein HKX48_004016 [Thoreauomyces humboldtii]